MSSQDLVAIAKLSRISALKMVHKSRTAHIGSSLSVIDIAVQLFSQIKLDNLSDPNRNVVLVSKGHAAAGIYAVMAHFKLIPYDLLDEYCVNGGAIGGHITSTNVPILEISTGSLGHALPFGVGRAFAKKNMGLSGNIYVILSDGECDEGSNREAALLASHLKLDNLKVVIDRNGLQSLGETESTLGLEPLGDKWKAFGWQVNTINGHNFGDLAKITQPSASIRPTVFIAQTKKGYGVSFMENNVAWHYKSPNDLDLANSVLELD